MSADTTGGPDPERAPDPAPIADGDVTPPTEALIEDFRKQVEAEGYALDERKSDDPRWFHYGDVVRDRENANPNPAVVVAVASRIDEWDVDCEDGPTVADINPTYDPSDRTVVVVYADDLARRRPDYAGGERLDLSPLDDVLYAFPRDRLDRIGWGIDDGDDDEQAQDAEADQDHAPDPDGLDLGAVADAIRKEYGGLTVEYEPGAPVVTVTTTLSEWTVTPAGAVEGREGKVYDALTALVAEQEAEAEQEVADE